MGKDNKKAQVEDKRRFEEASKNLRDILEEIRPFIKKKKIEHYSTTGKWRESSFLSEDSN